MPQICKSNHAGHVERRLTGLDSDLDSIRLERSACDGMANHNEESEIDRLFCYGSLQVPQVVREVIGRSPDGFPAELPDYSPRRVKGASYPGITPVAGESTNGLVYSGLSRPEFAQLDDFEGEPYVRELKKVRLDGGSSTTAWVYLLPTHKLDRLTNTPWHLESFIQNDLAEFMRRCFGVFSAGETSDNSAEEPGRRP